MLSDFFVSDNVKFVLIDDSDIDSFQNDYLVRKNYFVEVKIKKSYFEKVLKNINDILTSNDCSDIAMTEREVEVLSYLVDGLNNQQISKLLNISVHTTKAHIHNIFSKLCVQCRTQAVAKAIKNHLI